MCQSTGSALLASCEHNPDDSAPRLVYADWLDENDRSEEAATIRSEVKAKERAARMLRRKRDMAIRVWEWAKEKAHALNLPCRSYLEHVEWSHGYAETGYSDPEVGLIAFGNWNDVNRRVEGPPIELQVGRYWLPESKDNGMGQLAELLERLGVEIEWSDEWGTCGNCGKAVRTQPDSHSWSPSYNEQLYQAGEFVCLECEPESDPEPSDCPECGEELDKDCNGGYRCVSCSGPCPCCSDGPGPGEESEDDESEE